MTVARGVDQEKQLPTFTVVGKNFRPEAPENAPVKTSVDTNKQMTTQTITGVVSLEELMKTLKLYWEGQPTMNLLWDIRKANLENLSKKEMKVFVDHIRLCCKERTGCKAAFVATNDFDTGSFKLAEMLDKLEHNNLIAVFRSIKQAMRWLE